MQRLKILLVISAVLHFAIVCPAVAKVVQYDLDISYKTRQVAGKEIKALAIDDSIPGPALNFREGDVARIIFKNSIDVATSIHWHGILFPSGQGMAPSTAAPLIQPGETKKFEFTIKQSGTHWFHIHEELQKRRGVFGSIVITPKEGELVSADKSEVIVLMDWTKDDPDEVLHTLKSGNDYYSLKKGSMQSLWGAVKEGALVNVMQRSFMRMPPMDISDVPMRASLPTENLKCPSPPGLGKKCVCALSIPPPPPIFICNSPVAPFKWFPPMGWTFNLWNWIVSSLPLAKPTTCW